MTARSALLGSFVLALLVGAPLAADPPRPYADGLQHTYSIVARDAETGELGVAVQTHWFAVGRRVPWAASQVGAIATQSFTNPDLGAQGLEMLRQGVPAAEALDRLIAEDDGRDRRQVAIVDSAGRVAAWTGEKCIPAAGHQLGEGYAVAANLMRSTAVWPAMAAAYEAAEGPLAERMLAALRAGEEAGGDIRGRQSAALLVVRGEPSGKAWKDRLVDLRVDDAEQPLDELARLLRVHRAYEHMTAGDEAIDRDDFQTAGREYGTAEELFPENLEMQYWHAVSLANKDRLEEAKPLFETVFRGDPSWRELTGRLPEVELLTLGEEDLAAVLELGTGADPSPAVLRPFDLASAEVLDLSWTYGEDTLYWPTSPSAFELTELAHGMTEGGFFYSANAFATPEHGGTHLDAPIHFHDGVWTSDEIPIDRLVRPAVVIDVVDRATADADYTLTVADLSAWESRHGPVPAGSIVLLRTGWDARWPDARAYLGDDRPGDASNLHFPAFGAEAARILIEDRAVVGLGLDTASIDPGNSTDFPVHRIAAAANVYGLENLRGLERLPPSGAWLAALPIKIEGGSGGPARVVAFLVE